MPSKSGVKWSIKEITECMRQRQMNKFDANIGVSGKRGDGKSTFLFKIFQSFRKQGFRPYKHQVYSQDNVKSLLCNQKFGFCWDDEAINSGYKRDFQKTGQIELIKIVTNYRDNFNIYGSALPFFYSLDKALRELIFMHVHIIARGVGVVLLPLEGQIHSQDPWDTMTNKKIEFKENARLEKNSDATFRFHKLTTFAGYIFFNSMTDKQEQKYVKIKQTKRAKLFESIDAANRPMTFLQKLYDLMLQKKLTKDGLSQACLVEGKKYTVALSSLNMMLKDKGDKRTAGEFIVGSGKDSSKLSPEVAKVIEGVIT